MELPPLRRRRGDVTELARHFWRALGSEGEPPSSLLDTLSRHRWPGNVRELKNRIARLVALGADGPPDAPSTPEAPDRSPPGAHPAGAPPTTMTLFEHALSQNLPLAPSREIVVAEFERQHVACVLEVHGGNVVKAASASGLARRYFQLLRAKRAKPI